MLWICCIHFTHHKLVNSLDMWSPLVFSHVIPLCCWHKRKRTHLGPCTQSTFHTVPLQTLFLDCKPTVSFQQQMNRTLLLYDPSYALFFRCWSHCHWCRTSLGDSPNLLWQEHRQSWTPHHHWSVTEVLAKLLSIWQFFPDFDVILECVVKFFFRSGFQKAVSLLVTKNVTSDHIFIFLHT